MAITFYERARNLGLAGGCLWLTAVGAAFVVWSLLATQSALAISVLVVIGALAVLLGVFGVAMIRRIRRSPFVPAASTPDRGGIRRRFGMIVAAEVAAFVVVGRVCTTTHHWIWIVPLDLIVVGLHFLPLAKLFKVPRYYVTGALFCAIPMVTMLMVPSSAHAGYALSWIAMPAIGCGLVSLATAWAGLNEVRRFVLASRALA